MMVTLPEFLLSIPIIPAVFVVVYFVARHTLGYSLRSTLILTFVGVSLVVAIGIRTANAEPEKITGIRVAEVLEEAAELGTLDRAQRRRYKRVVKCGTPGVSGVDTGQPEFQYIVHGSLTEVRTSRIQLDKSDEQLAAEKEIYEKYQNVLEHADTSLRGTAWGRMESELLMVRPRPSTGIRPEYVYVRPKARYYQCILDAAS